MRSETTIWRGILKIASRKNSTCLLIHVSDVTVLFSCRVLRQNFTIDSIGLTRLFDFVIAMTELYLLQLF